MSARTAGPGGGAGDLDLGSLQSLMGSLGGGPGGDAAGGGLLGSMLGGLGGAAGAADGGSASDGASGLESLLSSPLLASALPGGKSTQRALGAVATLLAYKRRLSRVRRGAQCPSPPSPTPFWPACAHARGPSHLHVSPTCLHLPPTSTCPPFTSSPLVPPLPLVPHFPSPATTASTHDCASCACSGLARFVTMRPLQCVSGWLTIRWLGSWRDGAWCLFAGAHAIEAVAASNLLGDAHALRASVAPGARATRADAMAHRPPRIAPRHTRHLRARVTPPLWWQRSVRGV